MRILYIVCVRIYKVNTCSLLYINKHAIYINIYALYIYVWNRSQGYLVIVYWIAIINRLKDY